MKTLIKNTKIVTSESVLENYCLAYEGGIITYIGKEPIPTDIVIDADGSYVVAGFVDIHCHGCLGLAFNGASYEEAKTIADYHLSRGTTTMLATTSTSSMEELEDALANCERLIKEDNRTCVAGIFMEGPWLNPVCAGAQASKYMRTPDPCELLELKRKYPSIIRIGASSELAGGFEFGEKAVELGIVASIAHSDARFSDVEKAMSHGYNLMTHHYSGMVGTERVNAYRVAGAVEAGLYFDDMYVEIIADGKHLPPDLVKMIVKIKGIDRVAAVTDSLSVAGSPATCGVMSGVEYVIEDGVAKLSDRSAFAGSVATADVLLRTLVNECSFTLSEASTMLSATPAKIFGLNKGKLEVGLDSDIVVLNRDFEVQKIFIGEVYTTKKQD